MIVKYAKSAAVLAGSVMALGMAAPAFAALGQNYSLNGALDEAFANKQLDGRQLDPLVDAANEKASDALNRESTQHLLSATGGLVRTVPMLEGVEVGQ
ncbi:hypothetical protein [Streptomyces sp. MST-110588]|uniref:hypothetical protein n=1 Tax=Streptomyces sp. MST-110588 TaxID=2833628 RepID=UPI001F5C66F7|nr:hypothetical protein [Streptomyces sp. MST-110588]UNO44431.1 hypothetical protein KGS77_21375 [Streptomyces sp. MST-110588]